VSESFFVPIGDSPEPARRDGELSVEPSVERYLALEACVGPWSPDAMHGGPPSALLVRACERVAGITRSGQIAVAGQVALRTSVEFLSPVPVGEIEVRSRVVRAGRRITLAEAWITSGRRDVLHARTWLLATQPPDSATRTPDLPPDPAPGAPGRAPRPADCPATMSTWSFPYAEAIDWRGVSGDPQTPGDAAVWACTRIPIVPGERPTGLQRAVLVADSGNGISSALDWQAWSFVNVDLDVHLSRPPAGEWVLVDARTRYQPSGTGLATSVLHDEDGVVGAGAQTLLVTPRNR
jgi:hypothetical protein